MKLEIALKIIEDKGDKRWLRYAGEDYLNERDVKRVKRAAETMLKAYRDSVPRRQRP